MPKRSNHIRVPTTVVAIAAGIMIGTAAPVSADGAAAIRSGTFSGQSGHEMSGRVTIEREGERTFVVLHDDFLLDGAPAPTLGFSNDGVFDQETEFAELASFTGAQRYEVPGSIQTSDYDTFTVWCADFSVPLGSAPLD